MSMQTLLQRLLDRKLQIMIPICWTFLYHYYNVSFHACCCVDAVTLSLKWFKNTQAQWQLQWLALPCDCSNSSWTISVQALQQPKPGFRPAPKRSVCLLRLASTSDLRRNMLSAANTGPVTACLPPACAPSQASPQNKAHHYHQAWPSEPGSGGLGVAGARAAPSPPPMGYTLHIYS